MTIFSWCKFLNLAKWWTKTRSNSVVSRKLFTFTTSVFVRGSHAAKASRVCNTNSLARALPGSSCQSSSIFKRKLWRFVFVKDASLSELRVGNNHTSANRPPQNFFYILTLWRSLLSLFSELSVRVPGCQKLQMTAGLTWSGTECFIAVPIWQQWASKGYRIISHIHLAAVKYSRL